MRIFGREKLRECGERHAIVRPFLSAWLCEVESQSWRGRQELMGSFASVRMSGECGACFHILQSRFVIETQVCFPHQLLLVKRAAQIAEREEAMARGGEKNR